MKTDIKCGICERVYVQQSNCDGYSDDRFFGMKICPKCKERGLGYFLHQIKELIEKEESKLLKEFAKEICRNQVLEGKWWDKKSQLYKKLIIKKISIKWGLK